MINITDPYWKWFSFWFIGKKKKEHISLLKSSYFSCIFAVHPDRGLRNTEIHFLIHDPFCPRLQVNTSKLCKSQLLLKKKKKKKNSFTIRSCAHLWEETVMNGFLSLSSSRIFSSQTVWYVVRVSHFLFFIQYNATALLT